MAKLTVNPTRMELTKLKKRLTVAVRGHKLLKDKRDELMRQFLLMIGENRSLRKTVEAGIKKANEHFIVARSVMQDEMLTSALMLPKQKLTVDIGYKNVMSVSLPEMKAQINSNAASDNYPYGYAYTTSDLDEAVLTFDLLRDKLILLAEKEKSCQLFDLLKLKRPDEG